MILEQEMMLGHAALRAGGHICEQRCPDGGVFSYSSGEPDMLGAIMRVTAAILLMVPCGTFAQTSPQTSPQTRPRLGKATRGSGRPARRCHVTVYEPLEQDSDNECRARSKTHPDAIIPDLSNQTRWCKFTKDDIAFVYGSKWKRQYFTEEGR